MSAGQIVAVLAAGFALLPAAVWFWRDESEDLAERLFSAGCVWLLSAALLAPLAVRALP